MTPCYITALQCPYIIIYYYYHPIIPSKLYRQKIALNDLKCRPLSGCHQVRSAPHSDATDATGGEVFICPHAERFDAPSVWLTIQDRICRGVGRVFGRVSLVIIRPIHGLISGGTPFLHLIRL